MQIISPLALLSLALIGDVAVALPSTRVPRLFRKHGFTRSEIDIETIKSELGPELSDTALIFGPDNDSWDESTERFSIYTRPDVQLVVQPGAESDVPTIVKYANENSIDFFTYGRGHGQDTKVATFSGMLINMEHLNFVHIASDRQTAVMGAGLDNGQLIRALWDEGLVTPSGATSCVGLFGAALGGGHGLWEGHYGLVIDALVHLNVVLADGTAIGVNETSYPDLLWAFKGAGHNFGIVTSAEMKVYPRGPDTWHWHNYWWSGEHLETIFEAVNALHLSDNGDTPVKMALEAGLLYMNATASDEPIFQWTFGYAGPAEDAEELLAPFNAIPNLGDDFGDVPFPEVAGRMGNAGPGGEEAGCVPYKFLGTSTILGPYNITTQRAIFDLFKHNAELYPELAPLTRVFNEGHSKKAVEAVDYDSTAYAHRALDHVCYVMSANAEDIGLVEESQKWIKDTWDLWLEGEGEGAKPITYPNYNQGQPYETVESMYGYEPWRLEKLRALKAEWDPENKFRYYIPIIEE